MDKFLSLADVLGVQDPRSEEKIPAEEALAPTDIVDIEDPTEFCKRILGSREFRQYIMSGIVLGGFPGFTSILSRVMDQAGWSKVPERHEHTGKDGAPIVTEVRRVIVRASDDMVDRLDIEDDGARFKVTH